MIKKIITIALIIGFSLHKINAYDFLIDGIAYNRFSDKYEVEVAKLFDNYAYAENYYKGDITIPQTVTYKGKTFQVTRIGKDAFLYAEINSISLPNSINTIGESAFDKCKIKSKIFALPSSVKRIESLAFDNCSFDTLKIEDLYSWCTIDVANLNSPPLTYGNKIICLKGKILENVVIPHGVTSIATCAFRSSCIKSVTIPNSVVSIGALAFGESSITTITIPNSVQRMEWLAFRGCKQLERVIMSNSITKDEGMWFEGCSSLKYIQLSSNLQNINSFQYCYSLEAIHIPESVITINAQAFYYCKNLKEIHMPKKLNKIGENAFYGCDNFERVFIDAVDPPTIYKSTFTNNTKKTSTLYVPDNSISLYKSAPEWKDFYDIMGISVNISDIKEKEPFTTEYDLFGIKNNRNTKGVKIIKTREKIYKVSK